jgi:hypothetical protein
MAPCLVTGQAAGTAAAMAARRNAPLAELHVPHLQEQLLADRAYLGRRFEAAHAAD